MERAEVYSRLADVFRDVFDREVALADETTAADVPGWDSLNHITLIGAVEDEFDVELGQEASKYIEFQPSESSVFRMKITGESLGMRKTVECECYYNGKDKKVRYVKWKED
jgi:acyl carrier protein